MSAIVVKSYATFLDAATAKTIYFQKNVSDH